MSRLNRDEFDIQIDDIWINKTEHAPNGVLGINWSGNPGWGEWIMILDESGIPHINTEHMDIQTDKRFTKALLKALLERMIVDD